LCLSVNPLLNPSVHTYGIIFKVNVLVKVFLGKFLDLAMNVWLVVWLVECLKVKRLADAEYNM